jgi:hypothetical protein
MKKYHLLSLVGLAACIRFPSPLLALASSPWGVHIGPEVLISPGYHSFVNDTYGDTSGGYGWLGLRVGIPYKVSEKWDVGPQMAGYFNFVSVEQNGGTQTKVNFIGVPALAARYFPVQKRTFEWSLGGDIGTSLLSLNLPDREFNSGTVAGGVSTGLRFEKTVNVLFGYEYIPVKTSAKFGSPTTTYDFGGIRLGFSIEL